MSRLITPIFILAFVPLCLAFWNVKAQSTAIPQYIPDCQDFAVDYYNQGTLVDNVVPLEQGGCTYGDDNILFELPQGPQDSLDAWQYPQNNPQPNDVIQNIIGPDKGIIFGSSDTCVNLGNKVIYGYQQGGELRSAVCDGTPDNKCLNNNRFVVTTTWNSYSTTRTFQDPSDPNTAYISGRNDSTDQITWSASTDGQNWAPQGTIDDASGATDGATRFFGGLQNDNYYALYSSTDPTEYNVEFVDTKTGVEKVVDKDIRGHFKESCCQSVPGTGRVFCSWYNFRDNTVRGLTAPVPLNDANDVEVWNLGLAPSGPFQQGNFNPACGVNQNGTGIVAWTGMQNLVVYDPNNYGFCLTNTPTPWSNINSSAPFGTAALVPITDPNAIPERFQDGFPSGDVGAWTLTTPGSLELFQFIVFPRDRANIPTLGEWGLITLAAILGIVGFMVMRRRKVTV